MTEALHARLATLLAPQVGIDGLAVTSVKPLTGVGLSRSVLRLDGTDPDGGAHSWVVLLSNDSSPVAPNQQAEFLAMRQLSAYPDLKVPRAFCLEETPDYLGAAFLVTEHVPGRAENRVLLEPEFEPLARTIAEESFALLGRMSRIDAAGIDLGADVATPAPDDIHLAELDRHESVLRATGGLDSPVVAAALRHLHRTRPATPERTVIVHGDFRLGNYLFDRNGITGLIDWEMVHKGDPLEDLAWACLPNWQSARRPGLVAACLTRDEAIAAWEATSGLQVDRASFAWWTLLCQLKATAVRTTLRDMFRTGKTDNLLAYAVGLGLPLEEAFVVQAWKECQA